MLRFLPGLFLSFVLMTASAQSLRVMSYNIRYDNPADGPNAWSNRKSFLVEQVKTADPDILGVQESLPAQVDFLAAYLPGYGRAGVGRDENGTGESTTIFFRLDRFEMTESRAFWLSETPDVMSQGWDAAIRRICTYVRLTDKLTHQSWLVLNTHFDHVGEEARKQSAELIVKKIKELNAAKHPVILMGDFNATPESAPLVFLRTYLAEARRVAKTVSLPQAGSYNAFDTAKPADRLIDHVFVSADLSVEKYQMFMEMREGRYPSDHFPVMAEISAVPRR